MKKIDLVILAGGRGSRISLLTKNNQKCTSIFNKKIFLNYVLNYYCKFNFNKIFILTGYKSEKIHKYYNNYSKNFVNIECLKEKKPLGTGGALSVLKDKNINDFILINGDTFFEVNPFELIKFNKGPDLCTIALTKKNLYKTNKKLSSIKLQKNLIIANQNGSYMNGGVYFFKKKILKFIKKKFLSLENEILPNLIDIKKVSGKYFNNFFLDIGTNKTFLSAEKILKNKFTKSAVFLDRDGVINHNYGYVHNINKFKFRKGVIKGLKFLIKKNFYIFIISNQAGVGKGYFTKNNFFKLHIELKKILQNENIFFDDVKYCFHHPEAKIAKYKKNCPYRKPGNKMIKELLLNWDINLYKSFMIGDNKSDFLCAKKSKIQFFYATNDFNKQIKKIINVKKK